MCCVGCRAEDRALRDVALLEYPEYRAAAVSMASSDHFVPASPQFPLKEYREDAGLPEQSEMQAGSYSEGAGLFGIGDEDVAAVCGRAREPLVVFHIEHVSGDRPAVINLRECCR